MATDLDWTTDRTQELTREQGWELLDKETRKLLGMSAREFVSAWKAGKFPDWDENEDLPLLVMMLPFVGEDPRSDGKRPKGAS